VGDRRALALTLLIVAAVLLLFQTTRPGGSPAEPAQELGGADMTPIFAIVSFVLNLILSGAIVLRLFFFRQRIRKELGSDAGRQYITVAAMLIDSAMIYAVVWLCSSVPTLLQVPFQYVVSQACIHVQVWSATSSPTCV
jgi:hypothetical protein